MEDILKKINTGHTQELTDHLNLIDDTGNIKFAHKEETEKSIAFLKMKSNTERMEVLK